MARNPPKTKLKTAIKTPTPTRIRRPVATAAAWLFSGIAMVFVVGADYAAGKTKMRSGGRLADLAPTLLALMELPKPPEMTGVSLLRG